MEIGPALPPHLAKKPNKEKTEEQQSCTSTKEEKTSSRQPEDNASNDEDESFGPALPPGFQKKKEQVSRARVIGPMRPPEVESPRAVSSSGLCIIFLNCLIK